MNTIKKHAAAKNGGGSVGAQETKTLGVSDLIEGSNRALPAIKPMGRCTETIRETAKMSDASTTGHRTGWKTVAFTLLASLLTLHYEDGTRLASGLPRRDNTPHQVVNMIDPNSQSLRTAAIALIPAPISSTSISINMEQVSSSDAISTDGLVVPENKNTLLATVPQARK